MELLKFLFSSEMFRQTLSEFKSSGLGSSRVQVSQAEGTLNCHAAAIFNLWRTPNAHPCLSKYWDAPQNQTWIMFYYRFEFSSISTNKWELHNAINGHYSQLQRSIQWRQRKNIWMFLNINWFSNKDLIFSSRRGEVCFWHYSHSP